MSQSRDERFRRIMDGSDASAWAGFVRAAAAGAEPIYSTIMRIRNALYDARLFSARPLGKPAISVGNITTGGTGKTPVVQWLGHRLQAADKPAAVLMRGYKSTAEGISDEQAVLSSSGLAVVADPDRLRGASTALSKYPQTAVFVLDDAMQHRRVARNFDLVLINAVDPFGLGRVFPRGLLREPLAGLKRADALLITHADEITPQEMDAITFTIRQSNKRAPIFHCDHVISALRSASGLLPIESISEKKYFAFCGIGSPESFFWRLQNWGGTAAGNRVFDDHHDYTQAEVAQLAADAESAGAEMLITTAKDWVKIREFEAATSMPIYETQLVLRFWNGEEEPLIRLVKSKF